jgi:hypothetical protein
MVFIYKYIYFLTFKKILTKRGPLNFYCVFFLMVFVLTCLRMAQVQVKTCSAPVSITKRIKTNMFCVSLN